MDADAAPLPVPDDLRALMARHTGVDWGRIAWDAVRAKAQAWERVEALARRSRLRHGEAKALGEAFRGGP
jgi:hypothetical protein